MIRPRRALHCGYKTALITSNFNPSLTRLTGLILSGGQSRRFYGGEKGLVNFHGDPMVERVARVLRDQVDHLIISSNRRAHEYQQFADVVLSDRIGDSWGPLAGIYTGLCAATTDWLLVATCDQPLLPADYVTRMVAQCDGDTTLLAVDSVRRHFLNLLLPSYTKKNLEDYLLSGGRRVQGWLEQLTYKEVEFSPGCLDSINSPADLKRAESITAP